MVSCEDRELGGSDPSIYQDDSDRDPTYVQVWAACPNCLRLLCWTHFNKDGTCNQMHLVSPALKIQGNVEVPKQFIVDGSSKENVADLLVKKRDSKKKTSQLRNEGLGYISYKTKKEVPARKSTKARCISSM